MSSISNVPAMPSTGQIGSLIDATHPVEELVAVGSLTDAAFYHLPTGEQWPLGRARSLAPVKYLHEIANGERVAGEAPADVWLRQFRRVDAS